MPPSFHDQLPNYEEFQRAVLETRPGQVIQQHVASLLPPHSHKECAHAFIEQSPRRKLKRQRIEGYRFPTNQIIHQKMTRFWTRLLTEMSPYLVVQRIDADKWATKLRVTHGQGRIASRDFEKIKREEASRLIGGPIYSSDVADAVLLLSYGIDTLIAEFSY
jgi:hypothetical protein